jgi:hypothetical protein
VPDFLYKDEMKHLEYYLMAMKLDREMESVKDLVLSRTIGMTNKTTIFPSWLVGQAPVKVDFSKNFQL